MFRPPAREICLQTLEYVYKTRKFFFFYIASLSIYPSVCLPV